MEKWEREVVLQNWSMLVQETICTKHLLHLLEVKEVLNRLEVEKLESIIDDDENPSQQLYEIILKKHENNMVYKCLIIALIETRQFRLANILEKGQRTEITPYKKSCSLVEHDQDFESSNLLTNSESIASSSETSLLTSSQYFTVHPFAAHLLDESYSLLIVSTIDVNLTVCKLKQIFPDVNVQTTGIWNYLRYLLKCLAQRAGLRTEGTNSFILHPGPNFEEEEFYKLKTFLRFFNHVKPKTCFKLIIVCSMDLNSLTECTKNLQRLYGNTFAILEHRLEWDDISESLKKILLIREVLIQNKPVKIEDFCKRYAYNDKDQSYKHIMRDKLLVDLINYSKRPEVFRQTIDVLKIKGYISRKIRSRNCILKTVLQTRTESDVFLFSGFQTIEDLKIFTESCNGKCDTCENLLEKPLNAAFIFIRGYEDFEFISKTASSNINIHWLEQESGRLLWKKTFGNISFIQKHVCHVNYRNVLYEPDLLNINHKAVILCGSAGMGKSVLLHRLIRKAQTQGDTLVLFYLMNDFISAVQNCLEFLGVCTFETFENDTIQLYNAILETIQLQFSSYSLVKEIFCEGDQQRYKLQMFVDGLDEVSNDMLDFAFKCLSVIDQKFQNVQTFVATRPDLLYRLEYCFRTLGFNIMPFAYDDQVEFLRNHWSKNEYSNMLQTPAIIQYISEKDISISDIAGIPSQCLIFGEVFKKHAIGLKHFKPIPGVSTIFEQLIKQKLEAYNGKYLLPHHYQLYCRALELTHIFLSIQCTYPTTRWPHKLWPVIFTKNVLEELQMMFVDWKELDVSSFEKPTLPKTQIQAVGIVYTFGDYNAKLQFVQEDFKKYFLAKFVLEILSMNCFGTSSDIIAFVNEAVFETSNEISVILDKPVESFEFKFPGICKFVNSMLQSEYQAHFQLHPVVVKSTTWEHILHASVRENCLNIMRLYANYLTTNPELRLKLLKLAVSISATQAVDIIGYNAQLYDICPTELLQIAIERGDKPMFVHLFSVCKISEFLSILDVKPHLKILIGRCIANTTNAPSSKIRNKTEILNLLIQKYSHILWESGNQDTFSPFEECVHIDLLLLVLKEIKEENLLELKDKFNKTVLHKPTEYLNTDEYKKLIETFQQLYPTVLSHLSVCRDIYGQTPLHAVVRYTKPSTYTLVGLSDLKGNYLDGMLYTVTWNVIRYQKNSANLTYLLNSEAKLEPQIIDKFQRNSLHIAAQHSVDIVIFKTLIHTGLNINEPDLFGNTPVFYALQNPETNKVIRILHLLGAKLEHTNKRGVTILHFASELGKLDTIELLFQLSSAVTCCVDKNGNTPLHFALRSDLRNNLETVKYLVSKYSWAVSHRNKDNQCPLLYGISRRHSFVNLDTMEYLIQKSDKWAPEDKQKLKNYLSQAKCANSAEDNFKVDALINLVNEKSVYL